MNITIERMGKGHIINIETSVGLKPGWNNESLNERLDTIVGAVTADVLREINRQLPDKLKRCKT